MAVVFYSRILRRTLRHVGLDLLGGMNSLSGSGCRWLVGLQDDFLLGVVGLDSILDLGILTGFLILSALFIYFLSDGVLFLLFRERLRF